MQFRPPNTPRGSGAHRRSRTSGRLHPHAHFLQFVAEYLKVLSAADQRRRPELGFEPVEVLHSPLATHVRYRRVG